MAKNPASSGDTGQTGARIRTRTRTTSGPRQRLGSVDNETLLDLLMFRGLSLQEIADRAGISYATVWRWSRGRSTPRAAQFRALASALNVARARLAGAIAASGATAPFTASGHD